MFAPEAGDRVTLDHVVALQRAVGDDPALIDWPDGTLTVEPDAAAAKAQGGKIVAPQAETLADPRYLHDPHRVAAFINGRLTGRVQAWAMTKNGTFLEVPSPPPYFED